MKILLVLLALMGTSELEKAMLYLNGASSMEELSEEITEHYRRLSEHPLELNHATRGSLSASQLFNNLQINALIEYRQKNGDILSLAELAMVDAFTPEYVSHLKHFVSLESSLAPGARQNLRYKQKLTLRAAVQKDKELKPALRYEGELGQLAELRFSQKSASLALYGSGALSKIVLGNYHSRFGQGLLEWSGFSISAYSSISAFQKKASGLSPTSSTLSDRLGLGAEINIGKNIISAAHSFCDKGSIVNISRHSGNMSSGLTISDKGASADLLFSVSSIGVFAETCRQWNGEIGLLGGGHWSPGYGQKYATQLRWFSKGIASYSGIALGAEVGGLLATADISSRRDKEKEQIKLLLRYEKQLRLDSLSITPSMRAQYRYRPDDKYTQRAELRAEIEAEYKFYYAKLRADLVRCRDFAWLWHFELGGRWEQAGIYLRVGSHNIKYWDDRIYVYERNAPGTFSVPAYYNKGWRASLYAYCKMSRRHSVYLRLEKDKATLQYTWSI